MVHHKESGFSSFVVRLWWGEPILMLLSQLFNNSIHFIPLADELLNNSIHFIPLADERLSNFGWCRGQLVLRIRGDLDLGLEVYCRKNDTTT